MKRRNPPPETPFESYLPAPDPRTGYEAEAPGARPLRLEPREPAFQGFQGPAPPGPPNKRPPPRGGSPLLSGLLYALAVLVALAAGAAAFLLMSLPTDAIRDRLVAEVKARTGRDLVVSGPASFTFYPTLGVALSGVSLSAPPAMSAPPLVTMASLEVSVDLLPLLQGELEVKRLVLREPRFHLEIDRDGRRSWTFAARRNRAPVRLASLETAQLSDAVSSPAAENAPQRAPAGFESLALADVRIENGTLHYADARTGTVHDMEAIDTSLTAASIASPLLAKGRLVWRAKPVDFEASLTSVKVVLEDRPAKLTLAVKSEDLDATFDGTASFKERVDADGRLTAEAPSARNLARWLGAELSRSGGFGPFAVTALVRTGPKGLSLTDAEIELDGATARGQLAVETGGERPLLKATLKVSELDLNTYAATPPPPAPAAPAGASPAPDPAPDSKAPARSIDDLLDRDAPATRIRGFAARAGWSREPIDLSLLRLVDADARLSLGKLIVREIKTGPSELTVAVRNGVMKATFQDLALYDGRGRGTVTLDATAPNTPSLLANITLEGVSALPLLKDAADIDWLTGKGRLAFALAGKGQNQHEIVETLNGKVDFTFTDGAIVGLNIPHMARSLAEGRLTELEAAPDEKTDFSEFAATWTVLAGVAQNEDLRLTSPLLRVAGEGRVLLPRREIDYLLKPRLVADLAGQGGDPNAAGVEVPVRVEGPWEQPKFKADLERVLKDPNKAVETIKEIGKKLKGKSAGEVLKGIFGEKGAKSDKAAKTESASPASGTRGGAPPSAGTAAGAE
jgi:AsmA protein